MSTLVSAKRRTCCCWAGHGFLYCNKECSDLSTAANKSIDCSTRRRLLIKHNKAIPLANVEFTIDYGLIKRSERARVYICEQEKEWRRPFKQPDRRHVRIHIPWLKRSRQSIHKGVSSLRQSCSPRRKGVNRNEKIILNSSPLPESQRERERERERVAIFTYFQTADVDVGAT